MRFVFTRKKLIFSATICSSTRLSDLGIEISRDFQRELFKALSYAELVTNLSAAATGANSDITSLSGLTTRRRRRFNHRKLCTFKSNLYLA